MFHRFAANIQESTEWALVVIYFLYIVGLLVPFGGDNLSVHFSITLIHIIQTNLLQKATCYQKPCAVGGGVVLQTNAQSVTFKFGGAGLAKNAISIYQSIGNLANHLGVGETDDKTVLRGLVLVLILSAETLTLAVVSLSLATTTEFDLVPREVGLVGS